MCYFLCFFFSSRRRHTRYWRDWSSDVCSSDLLLTRVTIQGMGRPRSGRGLTPPSRSGSLASQGEPTFNGVQRGAKEVRSEEHTSELQSRQYLVCRLLLEKKKTRKSTTTVYMMQKYTH